MPRESVSSCGQIRGRMIAPRVAQELRSHSPLLCGTSTVGKRSFVEPHYSSNTPCSAIVRLFLSVVQHPVESSLHLLVVSWYLLNICVCICSVTPSHSLYPTFHKAASETDTTMYRSREKRVPSPTYMSEDQMGQ